MPFALCCCTITVLWCTLHDHHPAYITEARDRSPSYVTKTEPAFADMTAKLRRVIIAARFTGIVPDQPMDAETRAIQQAWAAASLAPTG
ncbi:hypothetical protein AB0H77_08475 [Streptomyces sp. NPDC050844]|uniref:hypothetical protein n=1 Tax=Streptomyces sp. NPDC050844 TaxID=3155790 RepID=UPI00340FC451